MAEKFDAYFKWLSIPPDQQPPHFYQLLGIPALTDDPDVIESAADRQAAHLRKHLDGQYRSYAEKILSHIETVKACLLDAAKKAEYDATLKKRIASAVAAQAAAKPKAMPAAAKPQPRNANAPADVGQATHEAPVVAPQSRRTIVVAGAVAVAILLIGGAAASLYFLRDRDPATVTSNDESLRPVLPAAQRNAGADQSGNETPDVPPGNSLADDANNQAATPREAEQPKPNEAPSDPAVAPPSDPASVAAQPPIHPQPVSPPTDPVLPPGDPAPKTKPESPPRLIPPADDVQQAKLKLIRDLFKSDYDGVTTPEEASALARMLIAQGDQTAEDPAGRFCLYDEARNIAVKAADVDTALQAIDRIASNYEMDQWQLKAAAVEDCENEIRGSEAVEAFVGTCLQLLDEVLADDRYDVAEQIVAAANTAGRKTRDVALKKEIAERRRGVEESKQQFDKVVQALDSLEQNPDDGDANRTAGRYFCFTKNDWQRGLPMLAAGGDAELAALAKAELDAPLEPDAKIAVAEAWWTFGEKETAPLQESAFRHASELVRQHWSSVDGLAKLKWEKRLKDAFPEQVATTDKPQVTPNNAKKQDAPDKPDAANSTPKTIPDNPAYADVLNVVDSYEQIYRQRKRAEYKPRVFEAESDFKHGTGDKVDDGLVAIRGRANPDKALMYGPYLTDIPVGGPHMATFRMMVSGQVNPRRAVASIAVMDAASNKALISQEISADEIRSDEYFEIGLPFFCGADHRIEFRMWWKDNGAVKVDRVTLSPAPVLIPNAWYTTFYAWPKWSGVPDKSDWQTILRTRPIGQRVLSHLGLFWYFPLEGPVRPFAAVANAAIELPAGRYEINAISDDATRVFFDGREVINQWWPHASIRKSDVIAVRGGKHAVRVDYCNGPAMGQIQCWFRPVGR